jgi:hypothetical protein
MHNVLWPGGLALGCLAFAACTRPPMATRTELALPAASAPSSASTAPQSPKAPSRLEFRLLDDAVDVLAGIAKLPLPPGIEVRTEDVRVGPGKYNVIHYAVAAGQPGASRQGPPAHLRQFMSSVPVRPNAAIGYGPIFDDADPDAPRVPRWRTYVLLPAEPGIEIQDAEAQREAEGWSVAITLTPSGKKTFERLTRANTKKRLAIVVDRAVATAAVIQAPIAGGQLVIVLGASGSEAEARALAQALRTETPAASGERAR